MADCHRPARFVMLSPDTPRRGGRMSAAPPTRRGGRAVSCRAGVRRAGPGRDGAMLSGHGMTCGGGVAAPSLSKRHGMTGPPANQPPTPRPRKGQPGSGPEAPPLKSTFRENFGYPYRLGSPCLGSPSTGPLLGYSPMGPLYGWVPPWGPLCLAMGMGSPRTGAAKLQARGG